MHGRVEPEPAVEPLASAAQSAKAMAAEGEEELIFCPECHMKLARKEGCIECVSCGWGLCK